MPILKDAKSANDMIAEKLFEQLEEAQILEQQVKRYLLKRYLLGSVYKHREWWVVDKSESHSGVVIRNPKTADGHFKSISELLEWCEINRNFEVDNANETG